MLRRMDATGRHGSEGVHIVVEPDRLVVRHRSLAVVVAVAACLAALIAITVGAWAVVDARPDGLAGVWWIVAGVGLAGGAIVGALPTEIVVDGHDLRVTRRSPSRRPGIGQTPLADVTRAVVVRERDDRWRRRTDNVHVYVRRIGSVPVVSGMPSRAEAEAIRDAINAHLRRLRASD